MNRWSLSSWKRLSSRQLQKAFKSVLTPSSVLMTTTQYNLPQNRLEHVYVLTDHDDAAGLQASTVRTLAWTRINFRWPLRMPKRFLK